MMRVAVAQFASKPDAAVNRARALELLRNAAEGGAELVVLPEAAILARSASSRAQMAKSECSSPAS